MGPNAACEEGKPHMLDPAAVWIAHLISHFAPLQSTAMLNSMNAPVPMLIDVVCDRDMCRALVNKMSINMTWQYLVNDTSVHKFACRQELIELWSASNMSWQMFADDMSSNDFACQQEL